MESRLLLTVIETGLTAVNPGTFSVTEDLGAGIPPDWMDVYKLYVAKGSPIHVSLTSSDPVEQYTLSLQRSSTFQDPGTFIFTTGFPGTDQTTINHVNTSDFQLPEPGVYYEVRVRRFNPSAAGLASYHIVISTEDTVSNGIVSIDINHTSTNDDDITLYNPGAFAQSVEATITLDGLAGQVKLSVNPPGAAMLSKTILNLSDGGSEKITITPTGASQTVNDVTIEAMVDGIKVGEEDMTIVSVTIPQHIRNATTPASMTQDRIPPFGPAATSITPINVTVTPNLAGSGQSVFLGFLNQSDDNGYAAFEDGSDAHMVNSSGSVNITGLQQTRASGIFLGTFAVGAGKYAGNLRLVLRVHGQDTIQSNGFSVAAIPINFSNTPRVEADQPPVRQATRGLQRVAGMWTNWHLESDSGNVNDLNAVFVSEEVQLAAATSYFNIFRIFGISTSAYYSAISTNLTYDRHMVTFPLNATGTMTHNQTFKFMDLRTGESDIPMPHSGFSITFSLYKRPIDKKLILTVTKFPRAVTANGIFSQAGFIRGGSIRRTQVIS